SSVRVLLHKHARRGVGGNGGAADGADRRGGRARRAQRHRRDGAQPAADAGEDSRNAPAEPEEGVSAMKPFAYVNAANEKEAIAARSKEYEKSLPIGGGQELLARMKDYVTQPDRVVNVKNLDATVTRANGG